MIKFAARTANGDRLVGIGLSHENIGRMIEGRPVHFDLKEMGIDAGIQILVFTGESEEAMQKQLSPLMGDQTVVHVEEQRREKK